MDRTMSILAWNTLAAALYTDFAALPPAERNLLRLTFLDPHVRGLYTDWETSAREGVCFLRMDAAQAPDNPALQALVGELSVCDEDFWRWWASHEVAHKTFDTKGFRHPAAGDLTLDWQILTCRHDPDQFILIMTAEPGTPPIRHCASSPPGLPNTPTSRSSINTHVPSRNSARTDQAGSPLTRPVTSIDAPAHVSLSLV
jgi:hypothetical protein